MEIFLVVYLFNSPELLVAKMPSAIVCLQEKPKEEGKLQNKTNSNETYL